MNTDDTSFPAALSGSKLRWRMTELPPFFEIPQLLERLLKLVEAEPGWDSAGSYQAAIRETVQLLTRGHRPVFKSSHKGNDMAVKAFCRAVEIASELDPQAEPLHTRNRYELLCMAQLVIGSMANRRKDRATMETWYELSLAQVCGKHIELVRA